jgi:formylmethanofuran dehydrogenase subunit E
MCSECHSTPCLKGCPFYDDSGDVAFKCDCCGEVIYIGDEYYDDDFGERLCLDCLKTKYIKYAERN